MKSIILASDNRGKIAELSRILSPIICLSQADFAIESPAETGLSFVENALIKARHVSRLTGKPALADDSGLCVSALHGAPGIYSARFAGENASDADNIQLLLEKMQDVPPPERQAFFYCAIVLLKNAEDPTPLIACGKLTGIISLKPSGDQGFGYDPVFYLPDQQCTLAQLPAHVKNTLSHRAKALQQLRSLL